MSAFEGTEVEYCYIGMAGGEFGCPDLLRGVGGEVLSPDIADVVGRFDDPFLHILSEKLHEVGFLFGNGAHGECLEPQGLKLVEDFMVEPGVGVVGTSQKQNDDLIVRFGFIEDGPALFHDLTVIPLQCFPCLFHGPSVLVFCDTQLLSPGGKELFYEQFPVVKIQCLIDIDETLLGKQVTFLGKGGIDHFGCTRDNRAGGLSHGMLYIAGQFGHGREPEVVKGFFGKTLAIHQRIDMGLCNFCRVAGIYRTVLGTFEIHVFIGKV